MEGFAAMSFQVIGVDLAALPNIAYLSGEGDFATPGTSERTAEPEVGEEPALFISKTLASKQEWKEKDRVSLVIDDQVRACVIAGILPGGDFEVQQPDNLIVMDLPQLQAITSQSDRLHRVEVRVPAGHWETEWREEAGERLRAAGEGRWLVETPDQRRGTGSTMTQAFRLNLSILSCLALIVGVYLILQALEAAVVRRRPEIATLRALGVSPKCIRQAWQVEALAMGALGALIGLLLGWGMAQLTVRAIAQTVNALYYSNTTAAAGWHWGEAFMAGSLGILASGLAGWLPAKEASQTPPAQILQRGTRSDGLRVLTKPWVGVALLIMAGLTHFSPPWRSADGTSIPLAGYASAFLWVAGAGVLCGTLFGLLARLGTALSDNRPALFYASSQLRQATGRHRLATAGLVVAVAMAGGMSILVGSFEQTVTRWLDSVMKADLFVACQGIGNASSRNRLHESTWRALKEEPAVANCEVSQFYRIRLDGKPTILAGVDLKESVGSLAPIWLEAPPKDLAEVPGKTWGVMSEPFAYRFSKAVGDVVNVPTPQGTQTITVVGIFADYGNEFGSLVVEREALSQWFSDERAARMAIALREGTDLSAIQAEWLQRYPGIVVTNNRELRGEALRIFHQTFAVTHGLKWIGVFVALAGLALALASMLVERQHELTTLRSLGLVHREIGRLAAWESLGLAIAGLVTGIALSLVLGHLIIFVINRQAFGWTLLFKVPWVDLAILTGGVLAISALVGYWTGSRVGKA